MEKTYVLDTSVLLQTPYALEAFEDNQIVLPIAVLEELDALKGAEGEQGTNARQAIRRLEALRAQGIRIGSTTGYTRSMMDVVLPAATAKGYAVDNCVTPDGLPAGRPAPYMIYKNMADLAIPSVDCVLKYGDTIADIKEGINAKAWTVGVVLGSNELGLTQEEVSSLPADELEARKADVCRRMLAAGAHYVVDTIAELPAVIAEINRKLEIL